MSEPMLSSTRPPLGRTNGASNEGGAHIESRTIEAVQRAIPRAPVRGLLADLNLAGAFDCASNRGGQLLSLTGELAKPAVRSINWQARTAWVAAGATVAEISRELLVNGWTLTELGGAATTTLAGLLALDSRGPHIPSNSPMDSAPRTIEFVDGWGEPHQFSAAGGGTTAPSAISGGLGLTGICAAAEVRIRPVSTGWMLVDSQRCETADELFDQLGGARSGEYSFARIDVAGTGLGIGRGTVVAGRHAKVLDLPEVRQSDALTYVPSSVDRSSTTLPLRFAGIFSSRTKQSLTHRTAPSLRRDELVPLATFFHSAAEDRLASKRANATLTYEFTVPLASVELIPRFLERLALIGGDGDNATVQRRTVASVSPLGISVDGWSFTIELTSDTPGLGRMLDEWDERVAADHGQVAVSTDSRMRPEAVAAMYPALSEWHRLRDDLDPGRHFCSDLSRRLNL